MILKPLELDITALPKEIEIELPQNADDTVIKAILENIVSEVVYNSKQNVGNEPESVPRVSILDRTADKLRLRIVA